jgi:hypothetical protein
LVKEECIKEREVKVQGETRAEARAKDTINSLSKF